MTMNVEDVDVGVDDDIDLKDGVFEYLVCQYKYPEPPGGEAPIFYRVSSQRSKREERLLNTRKSSQD